jgi:3-dehydroquinate synthase
MHYTHHFSKGTTDYYLNSNYSQLLQLAPPSQVVVVTDEQVHRIYAHLLREYRILIVPAGEEGKSLQVVGQLATKLAAFEADRKTKLIGIGGGMVTDITGFLAGIYMRGIAFGFVPTTLLGMVDAAIGGKNGVNLGLYKNMLGLVRQPSFILFDSSFLETLPQQEWSNGFAEIIKYACIMDAPLFEELLAKTSYDYRVGSQLLNSLIARCVAHKNEVVLEDEQEMNRRKTLNFGHTAGHAFETMYRLPHGYAVGLGMLVAFIASEKKFGLNPNLRQQLKYLLNKFGLPTQLRIDVSKVMEVLIHDKKRNADQIDFILLKEIGQVVIEPLSFDFIRECLVQFSNEYGT